VLAHLLKTKYLLFINGLPSFEVAVDCAAANNRLKRRRENQGEFGFAPEFAFTSIEITKSGPFPGRETSGASRQENILPPCDDRDESGKR
jgi:hypothetical protein